MRNDPGLQMSTHRTRVLHVNFRGLGSESLKMHGDEKYVFRELLLVRPKQENCEYTELLQTPSTPTILCIHNFLVLDA
jgi:hypothetical protein